MNPRVSRSSALASKATGFPIAKVAAKLAVGYTLDELKNDITGGKTPASFEPSHRLRRHQDPALRLREIPGRRSAPDHPDEVGGRGDGDWPHFPRIAAEGAARPGDRARRAESAPVASTGRRREGLASLKRELREPAPGSHLPLGRRIPCRPVAGRSVRAQSRSIRGSSPRSRTSCWPRPSCGAGGITALDARAHARTEAHGFLRCAARRSCCTPTSPPCATCATPWACGRCTSAWIPARPSSRPPPPTCIRPTRKSARRNPTDRDKIMVLGGGPNRIGQGIEFDYCCVHAALAMREDGFETIMVNCNPETVSTDYDTSDRLYFEPLTLEDVLEIVDKEKPTGVIVQYGGQTPLKLARALEAAGVPIIGTSSGFDRPGRGPRALPADDRKAGPEAAAEPHRAQRRGSAWRWRARLGYPLVVRPSYVLGGRAMEVVLRRRRPGALHPRRGAGVESTRRCCSIASSTMRSKSTST